MEGISLLFSALKKTAKHSLVYGIGTSFAAVSGLVLLPIYTRFLSPSDYGAFSLISIVVTLLIFVYDFGMVNALFRWYYQYDASQVAMRRRVISTAFIFLFTLALSLTLLLLINASFLSKLIFKTANFSGAIRLMLIGVFLQSLTIVPLSLLRIKEKVGSFTTIVIAGMVLMIITNYIFLRTGRGINGVYEAYIATYLFMLMTLFIMTREEHAIDFSLSELKGMLKFGVPYVPVLFFSWVIDFSDRYLLGHLATLQEVGIYSIGYKLGQVLYLVEKTFLIAWVPLMLSLHQKHKEKAPQIFGGIFTYYILMIFFLFMFVSVFSSEIIKAVTSSAYYGATAVVPWIAFSYLLSGIYIYMLSGLIIAKNVYLQPIILSVSAIINIALNIVLIPKFGMMGSAYATVFSYLMVAVFTTFFAQKLYPITIEWPRLAKIAVSAVAIFLLSTLVKVPNLMLAVMLKGSLIALLFAALYFIGFFSKDEIQEFRKIIFNRGFIKNA